MSYASWSVVFGEQPSAAKWNILGTNDASFNDGTGIAGLYKNLLTVDSNPYKFSAYRNAAANTGNGAFAVIAYDTEVFDTNNNLSSGVYTAPVAGYYQFDWTSSINTSGVVLIGSALHKNGTRTVDGPITTPASGVSHTGSAGCLINLAANDTVDIRAYGGSTQSLNVGNIYLNRFSGFLVSRT